MSGLWPSPRGCVTRPPDAALLRIPQKPYLRLGSLREQLRHALEAYHETVLELDGTGGWRLRPARGALNSISVLLRELWVARVSVFL